MPDPNPRAAQSTEAPDARHPRLDGYATPELVAAFVDDQAGAVAAVRGALAEIARAVDAALPRLQAGGRLIYVGAGTSGRLGVLDSVELGPTFDWPPERARALMAGGDPAMYVAVEGAGVVHQPAQRREGQLLSLEVAVRTLATERGDRRLNQPVVESGDLCPLQAPLRQLRRLQVLHQHVGGADQRSQAPPIVGARRIQHHASLAGIEIKEARGLLKAIDAGRALSRPVTARRLDLDHIGAGVGEQPGTERGRDIAT